MNATVENQCFLVPLSDGLQVEAVYYGSGTLCLSSQAGCAVGCPFCASGAKGLLRNLTRAELEQQLIWARRQGVVPRALTLSGIGEPLHNASVVRDFLLANQAAGLPVSLTTIGAPLQRLEEFLQLPHNGLMLSLHAGLAATHKRLIPRGPDFSELFTLLKSVWPRLSRRRQRKLGINYLLLQGVNDNQQELDALQQLLMPFPELTLHLLSCNPVPGSDYVSPTAAWQEHWYQSLFAGGLHVRRPNRWRRQSLGGCGTLVARAVSGLQKGSHGQNSAIPQIPLCSRE
ncbi:MAG: radical SAM protein [Trichloromonadaceae bacterium]